MLLSTTFRIIRHLHVAPATAFPAYLPGSFPPTHHSHEPGRPPFLSVPLVLLRVSKHFAPLLDGVHQVLSASGSYISFGAGIPPLTDFQIVLCHTLVKVTEFLPRVVQLFGCMLDCIRVAHL